MLLGSQMTVDEGDFPPSLVTNQQIQTLDTPIAYPKSTIPNLVNQDQTTFEKRANLAERHCLKQFLVKQRRIKIKLEQQDRLTGTASLSCHRGRIRTRDFCSGCQGVCLRAVPPTTQKFLSSVAKRSIFITLMSSLMVPSRLTLRSEKYRKENQTSALRG